MIAFLLVGLAQGTDWRFEVVDAPLTLRPDAPMVLPSKPCQLCHAEQYADWQSSMHRQSWTNPIFQAGYLVEQQDFCVYCHAPLAEQTAEVLENRAWYRAQHPLRTDPLPARKPEPYAAEGVNCVTCHWREGQMHGVAAADDAAHPITPAPELAESSFCAGCHEFNMAAGHNGAITFTDEPMQKTFQEWAEWGGAETCQGCHMPGGRHTFRGANDRALLRASVDVSVAWSDGVAVFCLESVGVGHHVPTGDLFRRLTLQIDQGAGFETVATIGRRFGLVADPKTGEIEKRLQEDTALRPDEPREITVEMPAGSAWQLRYHYGSEKDEQHGLAPIEQLIAVVAEGIVE
ncbi:MAG: hypothetical protein AAFV53_01545 [Myxococcota bacterium]